MSKTRLSAVLSLDVVGYSRLMELDAGRLLAAMNEVYRTVVRPAVSAAGGRVVKLLGDGALIEFASSTQALECALRIQQRLRANAPSVLEEPIRVRAGLHAGEVRVEGDDIFGEGVNVACRLQAAAQPGGILMSRAFCDLIGSYVQVAVKREGVHSLKGVARPLEVLSVEFDRPAKTQRNDFAKAQEVRFCRAEDGSELAWTGNGAGAPVVKAPNWIGHLQLDWRNPGIAPLITLLASRRRLIRFDARGSGLSNWDVPEIAFERFVDDLACIFDAAEVERAPILALSQGCAVAVAYAARCPDRVSGLILVGGFPLGRAKRNSAKDRDRAKAISAMMATGWDEEYPSLRDLLAQIIVPGASEEERRSYAEDMRQMISPANMSRYRDVIDQVDVMNLLPKVQVPCLVLHARGDRLQPVEQGRKLAAGLPDAKFVSFDSDNHLVPESDPIWPLVESEILAFLEKLW